jgi:hypothetical protein
VEVAWWERSEEQPVWGETEGVTWWRGREDSTLGKDWLVDTT